MCTCVSATKVGQIDTKVIGKDMGKVGRIDTKVIGKNMGNVG